MGHRTAEPPSAEIGNLKPLSEQVVVIMGASSGIGRETVLQVADVSVDPYGGFDTWVEATAAAVYARVEDTTPEEFRPVLGVNAPGNVPRLLDALLVRVGFRAQLSDQNDEGADNLERPLPGWGRSEGSFSRGAWSRSAYNWAETRASLRNLVPPVLRPPLLRDRSEPSVGSPV